MLPAGRRRASTRSALKEHIERYGTNPRTGESVRKDAVITPNRMVKGVIDEFFEKMQGQQG